MAWAFASSCVSKVEIFEVARERRATSPGRHETAVRGERDTGTRCPAAFYQVVSFTLSIH
jgi:hypothetical protein